MEDNSSIVFTEKSNISLNYVEEDFNYDLLIIGIYYFVILIGFCFNLCLIACLLRKKKNGTTYIVLQFCFTDLSATWITLVEVWSLYTSSWTFNSYLCSIFLGTEVLSNVITIYIHILLNFHAISTWNMQKKSSINKNPLTSDESNECLVWSENSPPNRTLNIDYRRKKSVSIILPSILVWFACLSLSIPEFTLSTTVEYTNKTLCTIIDLHYRQLLQFLLITFRDILPNFLLLVTFAVVLYKLCNNKSLSEVKKNSSTKKFDELKKLLHLSLTQSLLFILSSFQRSIVYCLHVFKQFEYSTYENFKMPPLDNFIITNYTNMFLSMLHYFSIVLRPIVCVYFIPSIVTMFIKIKETKQKERNQ